MQFRGSIVLAVVVGLVFVGPLQAEVEYSEQYFSECLEDAEKSYESGDRERALMVYSHIIDCGEPGTPSVVQAHWFRMGLHYVDGNMLLARQDLAAAKEADPDFPIIHELGDGRLWMKRVNLTRDELDFVGYTGSYESVEQLEAPGEYVILDACDWTAMNVVVSLSKRTVLPTVDVIPNSAIPLVVRGAL